MDAAQENGGVKTVTAGSRQYFTSVTQVSIKDVCVLLSPHSSVKNARNLAFVYMQLGEKRCCRIYAGNTSACLFYSKAWRVLKKTDLINNRRMDGMVIYRVSPAYIIFDRIKFQHLSNLTSFIFS